MTLLHLLWDSISYKIWIFENYNNVCDTKGGLICKINFPI